MFSCVQAVNAVGIAMNDISKVNLESEDILRLLQEVKDNPEMTQRELSVRLGISLGKVNFLIRVLMHKGFVKVKNFRNAQNKRAYFYYLTPRGFEEKSRITYRFLVRKMREYERLEKEIRRLKEEVGHSDSADDVDK